MGKDVFLKKICCVFLAIILCVPLIFFAGCFGEDDDEDNKPVITIAYKPFAGSRENIFSDTYGQNMLEDVMLLSGKILEELVDSYGQGSLLESDPRENNPSLNNVNIGMYLGNNNMSVNDQKKYAEQLNKMCFACYKTEDDVPYLILSKLANNTSNLTSGDCIYNSNNQKIYVTENERFVFVGGTVGPSGSAINYSANSGNYSNTVNFIKKVTNTNSNVIEKDFKAVSFGSGYSEGTSQNFEFNKWNWNLFGGNEGQFFTYSSVEDYLEAYVEEYSLKFAVELAKIKLVGDGNLPTDNISIAEEDVPSSFSISAGEFNLNLLYQSAQNGTNADRQKFVEVASVFIDHYGLTEYEATCLYEIIKEKVIGTNNVNATENNNDLKNNYETFIKFGTYEENGENNNSALKRAYVNNKEEVVLEFITRENASVFEEEDIDGYIKSVLLYFDEDIEPKEIVTFFIEIEKTSNASLDYLFMARCFDGEELSKGYYDVNDGLNNEWEVAFDLSEVLDYHAVGKYEDDITVDNFAYNKTEFEFDSGVYYNGWYYNDLDSGSFMEFVFASPNVFTLQHFNVTMLAIGYSKK